MKGRQDLAGEALRDVVKKHGLAEDLRQARKLSIKRNGTANDAGR